MTGEAATHFILVVDDNRDAADSMAQLLRLVPGCDAAAVYDGQAAVALAGTRRPDVVVLDLAMPVMGGLEAARHIRALHALEPPLILALTGHDRVGDELEVLDETFDHVLAKPADLDRLTAVVTQHLQRVTAQPDSGEDVAELLFRAAKQIAPRVAAKGLAFSCHMKGRTAMLAGDPTQIHTEMLRLLLGALDLLATGFLFFEVEVEALPEGAGRLRLTAAGTGALEPLGALERVARQLGLDAEPVPGNAPGSWRGRGVSPRTHATLRLDLSVADGVLLRASLERRQFRFPEEPEPPQARGARVWIVDDEDWRASATERQLAALGWRVVRHASLEAAEAAALQVQAGTERAPQLVLASRTARAVAGTMATLRERLDPRTRIVQAGLGSAARDRSGGGTELRSLPLSPGELEALTRGAAGPDRWAASEQGSLPGEAVTRTMALVVDDNEVNRIVAAGLLEALGYDTSAANDGLDAIEHCKSAPPGLVLMDVDMPVLSGVAATRRLRALQASGTLPRFAIVGATARADAATRAECEDAGMDGCLFKPLGYAVLRDELRRVLGLPA